MTYRAELHAQAGYVEAHIKGDFGGVAEAVRMYDGIGRACAARGDHSLLIIRDHAIAPTAEEGRLLMSELARIQSLAPFRIAYVVPQATPKVIELVGMANAYSRPLWRVFATHAEATRWISAPEAPTG